jgi:putative aminopeptidase FrvX
MRDKSLQFLERLVNTPSPSGREARGQRVWLDYVKPFADETFSDAYGNTVAVLNKGGSPRLMLAAHADEISMSVNYIDPGLHLCAESGRHRSRHHQGATRRHSCQGGPVKGVVGNVAPHLMKGDGRPQSAQNGGFVHRHRRQAAARRRSV